MPAAGTAGAFLSHGDRNCVCSMPLLTLRADCHSLLWQSGARFRSFANFQRSIGTSTIHWAL
jgi:hypothetical protein